MDGEGKEEGVPHPVPALVVKSVKGPVEGVAVGTADVEEEIDVGINATPLGAEDTVQNPPIVGLVAGEETPNPFVLEIVNGFDGAAPNPPLVGVEPKTETEAAEGAPNPPEEVVGVGPNGVADAIFGVDPNAAVGVDPNAAFGADPNAAVGVEPNAAV